MHISSPTLIFVSYPIIMIYSGADPGVQLECIKIGPGVISYILRKSNITILKKY